MRALDNVARAGAEGVRAAGVRVRPPSAEAPARRCGAPSKKHRSTVDPSTLESTGGALRGGDASCPAGTGRPGDGPRSGVALSRASYRDLFRSAPDPHVAAEQPQSSGLKRFATRVLFSTTPAAPAPPTLDLGGVSSLEMDLEHVLACEACRRWWEKGLRAALLVSTCPARQEAR